jgi:hypothetical protein
MSEHWSKSNDETEEKENFTEEGLILEEVNANYEKHKKKLYAI